MNLDSTSPPLPAGLGALPDDLRRRWRDAPDDVSRVRVLLSISSYLEDVSKWQAIEAGEAALNRVLQTDDQRLTVYVLLSLGFMLGQVTRFAEGLQHLNQAMSLAVSMGEEGRDLLLETVSVRATLRNHYGDERGARHDYEFVLARADQADDVTLLLTHVNLAWLYINVKQPAVALHQLRLADEQLHAMQERHRQEGPVLEQEQHYVVAVRETRTAALLLHAEQLRQMGRKSAMQEVLLGAQESITAGKAQLKPNELQPRMSFEAHLSNLRRLQGDLDAAGRHARECLRLSDLMGEHLHTEPFETLAAWHRARAQWPEAIAALKEALAVGRKSGSSRFIQGVLGELAELHERNGDLKAALHATREALRHAREVMGDLDDGYLVQPTLDLSSDPQVEHLSWQERLRMAEQQAHHDPLTGLLNRRGLEVALAGQVAASQVGSPTVMVAMLDIDHFKSVNDDFSHTVGDAVLRLVARVLRDQLPTQALLARYGGEEFLLVCPGQDAQAAFDLLERCRVAVARHDWASLLGQRPLTISAGYTVQSLSDFQQAVLHADEELYRAKQAGRDRICPPRP